MEALHLSTNSQLGNIVAVADYIANEVTDGMVYVQYNPYIMEPLKKGVNLRPEYLVELKPYMDIILSIGAQYFNHDMEFKFAGKTIKSNIMTYLVFGFYECQKKGMHPYRVADVLLDYILGLDYVVVHLELKESIQRLPADMKLLYLIDRLELYTKTKNGVAVEKTDDNKLVPTIYKWNNLKAFLDEAFIKDVFVVDTIKDFRDDIERIDVTYKPTAYETKGKKFYNDSILEALYTRGGVRYYKEKLKYCTGIDTAEFFDILKDL
ncbi:hypothetical protein ACVWU4_000991 [Campylobacter coli]